MPCWFSVTLLSALTTCRSWQQKRAVMMAWSSQHASSHKHFGFLVSQGVSTLTLRVLKCCNEQKAVHWATGQMGWWLKSLVYCGVEARGLPTAGLGLCCVI
jgi:hypothetical protein